LLPTGKPLELLPVAGMDPIEVSLVDIGNAHVFVRARDVGLVGTETAAEIDANRDLRNRLERIRGAAAVRMGMLKDAAASSKETPATPILGIVSPQAGYHAVLAERTIAASEVDLVSRVMFMQQAHKTYAGTSTVCTGVAARIPGTLVYEQTAPQTRDRPVVRIGHPAGVIETETVVVMDKGVPKVRRATLGRTARRILDGQVYVNPKKNFEHAA
jgi:2-methylaconitate cis-trans-isomerase PrpF